MVMTKFFLGVAALSAPLVAGHGYMGLPLTESRAGDKTSPVSTINSSQFKAPSGMSFTTDPESNTKAFTAWIKSSEYKSLRDLILKKGGNAGECGNTQVGAPQPLPAAVEWTHGASEGFTPSHQGPCEVWCDDEMAFHDDNCAKNFPAAPAKLPYDKSKCEGKKKLATYWLALQSSEWRVFTSCTALSGGATSPTPANSTPTVKPSTRFLALAVEAADEDCDENLPEPDCDTDLPEPDCDNDLPEPGDKPAAGGNGGGGAAPAPAPAAGGNGGGNTGADADCDEDLPEPDCDTDLPEPDCDTDLPEPKSNEYSGNEADTPYRQRSFEGFDAIDEDGGEDKPGKVTTNEY
jgi:hypothetical protein